MNAVEMGTLIVIAIIALDIALGYVLARWPIDL
ncbi:hypothetical protein GGD64_002785 [Bradyrhizobium sp. CIR3A]|nr:hypothetical protein [Bradyrhizobium sp. CIR3A]